jgi:glycosyltransferase involved in cell wall biosynthesis
MTSDKIKVLALMDYGCSTGFGQVASNIMGRLDKTGKYDITVIGINYDPVNALDPDRWPGRVIPAISLESMNAPDVYGRQKFLNELGKGIYDLVFTIQDSFIIQTIVPQIIETFNGLPKKFATIMYFPIDASPKRDWVSECLAHIDFPVPYTNYAREEVLKLMPELDDKLWKPIYHGTNLKDFYYIKDRAAVEAFKKDYFKGVANGKFLITNVNRNQPRKDIIRSLMVLAELKKRGHKDFLLNLHMQHEDVGGNILVMADHFGLKLSEDYCMPHPATFNANQGLPLEAINLMYNASDAVLTTTLGEGWGLSITEAMATRTPVVAPGNTSINEILAANRGYLIPSGARMSDWFSLGQSDNERLRPLMDVNVAADALEKIKAGELPDIDAAEKWAKQYSWDAVCQDWQDVFTAAYKRSQEFDSAQLNRQQRRAAERKNKKVGL